MKDQEEEDGALPIHLFRNFAVECIVYRLATKHITGGQADRQTDDIIVPIAEFTACSTIS